MPAPFAALEARANSAVLARLANVEATVDGVAVPDAIFDDEYAMASVGVGMATSAPMLTLATALVPAAWRNKPVVVGGKAFVIAEHQRDGTGMSVLVLEKAA